MAGVILDIRRLDGGRLRIERAEETAQAFFRLDRSSVGLKAYDTVAPKSSRDQIEKSDIDAINGTMAARSSSKHWTGLISQGKLAWLDALNPEWVLFELDDGEWTSLGVEAKLAEAFSGCFGKGRRLSVITKVLHMKRPNLIPVCDRYVLEQVGAEPGTDAHPTRAAGLIGHLRREGIRNLANLQRISGSLNLERSTPSLLRIFEAIIWQTHVANWRQTVIPINVSLMRYDSEGPG